MLNFTLLGAAADHKNERGEGGRVALSQSVVARGIDGQAGWYEMAAKMADLDDSSWTATGAGDG